MQKNRDEIRKEWPNTEEPRLDDLGTSQAIQIV